jgi:hypothetical protein
VACQGGGLSGMKTLLSTLKCVFPNTSSIRCRNPSTSKQETVYHGLHIRTVDDDIPVSFNDLHAIRHSKFFTIEANDTTLCLGTFTGDVVNGTKVILEVTFDIQQTYTVQIFGRPIPLESIGMNSRYHLNKSFILNLLDTFTRIQLCRGRSCPESGCPEKCIIENWSYIANENSTSQQIRSLYCKRIVTFMNTSHVCRICRVYTDNGSKQKKNFPQRSEYERSDDFIYLSKNDHLDMKNLLSHFLLLQQQYDYLMSNPKAHKLVFV